MVFKYSFSPFFFNNKKKSNLFNWLSVFFNFFNFLKFLKVFWKISSKKIHQKMDWNRIRRIIIELLPTFSNNFFTPTRRKFENDISKREGDKIHFKQLIKLQSKILNTMHIQYIYNTYYVCFLRTKNRNFLILRIFRLFSDLIIVTLIA